MAAMWDLGIVSDHAEKFLTFAYDDIYSIEYFGDKFEAYWKQSFTLGMNFCEISKKFSQKLQLFFLIFSEFFGIFSDFSVDQLLTFANNNMLHLKTQCEQFDAKLILELQHKGKKFFNFILEFSENFP